MNTTFLAEQIQAAGYVPSDAAQFLAEYAISGDYSGGQVYVGTGEAGYENWLYAIVYPVLDHWYMVAGCRQADGRFKLVDAASGSEAKSLTWSFCFQHRCDCFYEFTPDYTPEAAPVLALVPDEDEPGFVYILRLEVPLGSDRHSARFYTGWARNLDGRIYHHAQGRGAAFTRAAVERGIGFTLVWSMPGTRADERRIKNRKNARRFLQAQGVAA